MNEINLQFNYKSRYCRLGEINRNTKNIWIVCHGYGQLAPLFIKNFEVLNNKENCIIAPEGLSRFYLNGFVGRVGATWMTKEDRLVDIENYLNYLDAIYDHEINEKQQLNAKINLLGFSQGVATICRWATQTQRQFHKLILWAGVIPPDLNFTMAQKRLANKSTFIIYGNWDPYIKQPQLDEQHVRIEKLAISPQIFTFDGAHAIDGPTLVKLAKF